MIPQRLVVSHLSRLLAEVGYPRAEEKRALRVVPPPNFRETGQPVWWNPEIYHRGHRVLGPPGVCPFPVCI